jgi:hypothetical protein
MIKYIKSDKSNSEIKLNAIKAFRNLQADIDEMKSIVDSWEVDLFDNDHNYSDMDYADIYNAVYGLYYGGIGIAYDAVQEIEPLINEILSEKYSQE